MERPRVLLLTVLISCGCGSKPEVKDPPAEAAVAAPAAAPAAPKQPPRIVADAQGVAIGDTRVAVSESSLRVRTEIANALAGHRQDRSPQTVSWVAQVDPEAPARVWTELVAGAGSAGVALRFVEAGSTAEVALAARVLPPAGMKTSCSETGVAVGRGMTWVGRFAMTVDEHGGRPAVERDPYAGILALRDSDDPNVCRRLGGTPESIDLAALTAAVAALRPAANACGPVRVAVQRDIPWRRASNLLRALGEPGAGLVLADSEGTGFAGCGAAAFSTKPAFDLGLLDKHGPLEEMAIYPVLEQHGEESDACMAFEPPHDPYAEPRQHKVDVEVGVDGKVVKAQPHDANNPVEKCLAGAVTGWKFPEPRAPEPVKFTLWY